MLIDAPAPDSVEVAPESGAASIETQPQADPNFDGKQFGYVFRGETVYPKTKDEITELMQLGHSYRVNRDRFEQERQTFEQQQQSLQKYRELHEALEANPQFREGLWGYAQNWQNQNQQTQSQSDQIDPKYSELDQRLTTWEQRQADLDLERELNETISNHKEIDWNKDLGEGSPRKQLLKFMSEHQINSPEHAYWALFGKQSLVNAQHSAAANVTKGIKQQHKAGVVSTPGALPPAQNFDPSKHSLDELAEMAKADLARRG